MKQLSGRALPSLLLLVAACDPSFLDPPPGSGDQGLPALEDPALNELAARGTGFVEDFGSGQLPDSRYVAYRGGFGAGFQVRDGHLVVEAGPGEAPQLNLLPLLGRQATLLVDLKLVSHDDKVAFAVLADWRYRSVGPYAAVTFAPDRNLAWGVVEGRLVTELMPVTFPDGWSRLRVDRAGDHLTAKVNGVTVLEFDLKAKGGELSDATEAGYGAFAFEVAADPGLKVLHLDNLRVAGETSPVQLVATGRDFALGGDALRFTVIHPPDKASWAAEHAASSIACLTVEHDAAFGVRPAHRRLGMVWATGGSFYSDSKGFNSDGVVVYQPPVTAPGTFPNSHELGHDWQHLWGKRWSNEGTAQVGVRVWEEHRTHRFGRLTDLGKPVLFAKLAGDPSAMDQLLDDDALMTFFSTATGEQIDTGYWKSDVFSWALFRILGPAGFKRVAAKALASGHAVDSSELRAFVGEVLGRDATPLFAGWVFPGSGTLRMADLTVDTDGDGLSDLDEQVAKTSPTSADTDGDGSGDLGEANAGFDPTSAASPGAGALLADGLASEWAGVAAATDPDDGAGAVDLAGARVLGDATNRGVLVRIDYTGTADLGGSYLTLDFGAASDTLKHVYRVNVFFGEGTANAFDTSSGDFATWKPLDGSGVSFAQGLSGGRRIAEVFVPLDVIGGAAGVYLSWANSGKNGVTDAMDIYAPVALDRTPPKWAAAPWSPAPW